MSAPNANGLQATAPKAVASTANIAPALQSHVLDQMERPRFVVADTMDLWIEIARPHAPSTPCAVHILSTLSR